MRRALVLRTALGPLTPLAPVFTGAGFAKPIEVDTVERLLTQSREAGVDLLVVSLEQSSSAELDAIEQHLRGRDTVAVIGTATSSSSDLILAGFRRGFAEFLLAPPTLADVSAALHRLESKWAKAPRGGHVTAVFSPAGGAGVTTVAVNVAHAISMRKPPGRVAVADLVVGLGDVATQLNLSPTYDLGELVRKLDRADTESLHSIISRVESGFDVLAGTTDLELGEDVTPTAVQGILDLMRATYSYTVLDLDHSVAPRNVAALDAADRILMVFQVTVAGLRKVKRALTLFDQLEFPAEKVVLAANRVGAGDVMPWQDVAKALGRAVEFRIPNAYQAVADAQTRGIPVALSKGTTGAAPLVDAYAQLAARLMGGSGTGAGEGEDGDASRNGRAGFGRLLGKLRK